MTKLGLNQIFKKEYALQSLCILAGLLFVTAGIGKVVDTEGFAVLITIYGFKYFSLLAPFIAILEVVLGIALILLYKPVIISKAVLGLTIIFTITYTYGVLFAEIRNCFCFGVFSDNLPDSPFFLYFKNAILIIISVLVIRYYKDTEPGPERIKIFIILTVTVFAVFFSGYSFKVPKELIHSDKNEIRISGNISSELIKYYRFNNDSTYLVCLFSYSCPHCINSLENVNLYKQSGVVDKIVYLAYGSNEEKQSFVTRLAFSDPIIELDILTVRKLKLEFPSIFFVNEAKAVYGYRGTVPSPYVLVDENKKIIINPVESSLNQN